MRVIECTRYGPPEVLQWAQRPVPRPADHEVLVRVMATTVNSGDWRVRALALPPGFGALGRLTLGWRRPRQPVLGTEFAGVVVSVGAAVTRFAVGDRVLGYPGARMGCHAEYLCIAESGPVALMPPALGFEHAAALCFGGSTMLHFYRRAQLRAGERVLVVGASGTVGTAAVQLARHRGARVTAACGEARARLMQQLGAHATVETAGGALMALPERYDVVVDCKAEQAPARYLDMLAPGGRLLLLTPGLGDLLRAPWLGRARGVRVIAGPAQERPEDVAELSALAAQGAFMPAIDQVLPWEEFRQAHARVESRRKMGSVVLRVAASAARQA